MNHYNTIGYMNVFIACIYTNSFTMYITKSKCLLLVHSYILI